MPAAPIIRNASGDRDMHEIRILLREYESWLGTDLYFQDFEAELAGLPGRYAPPRGALLIAERDLVSCGCVALRPFDESTCEMKRLFVRADYRGTGLGRRLVLAIIEEARALGYKKLRLDTLPQQAEAHRLYDSLGFQEIEPYRMNPIAGSRFLELELVDDPGLSQ
jgi:GNAT superfamily N-acetyltransferase